MVVSVYAGGRPLGIVSAREFGAGSLADASMTYSYGCQEDAEGTFLVEALTADQVVALARTLVVPHSAKAPRNSG